MAVPSFHFRVYMQSRGEDRGYASGIPWFSTREKKLKFKTDNHTISITEDCRRFQSRDTSTFIASMQCGEAVLSLVAPLVTTTLDRDTLLTNFLAKAKQAFLELVQTLMNRICQG